MSGAGHHTGFQRVSGKSASEKNKRFAKQPVIPFGAVYGLHTSSIVQRGSAGRILGCGIIPR